MLKVNLNSLVKPKIFWPTMVILLALCITFYVQKEEEKSIRIAKETELLKTIAAKKVVENELTETQEAKKTTEDKLDLAEKETVRRDEQIKLVLDELESEIAAKKEVEAQLITVVKEKQDLELKIEELAAKLPKTIELERIVIKPRRELTGKILAYDKENTFVIIDLGSSDNLKLGNILSVYRDDVFIGRVQIEKFEGTNSAAVVLSPWKNVEYKENDLVKRL